MNYRMPGEFEPHHGCIMVWPYRAGSWPFHAAAARKVFTEVAKAISDGGEKVYMLAGHNCYESARNMLPPEIEVLEIETDDSWARDIGPTFVVGKNGTLAGLDWEFNAWGGEFDGLYNDWALDDAAAGAICKALGIKSVNMHPFVLEGGSIHSDGDGTLMVTESCLLSQGRNPSMTKEQIESKLCDALGASKVLWLPHGIWHDETNEHVDNVAAFVRPGEIVLAWTDDENDLQYPYSKADFDYLMTQTDARGRSLKVHKLYIPSKPVCITAKEIEGYVFEPGEDVREEGERLAASYANFYISNKAVIMPSFGDKNDKPAYELLQRLFPDRSVVQIYSREILLGGGNIHCITQQIPRGGIYSK